MYIPDSPRYVVIGNPIAQSKSPLIHRMFAAETLVDLDYQAALVELGGFAQFIQQFIAEGGKGANVTMPFKLDAFALSTKLSERAKVAGAVNTLTFADGEIFGDNTDGAGLVNDIQDHADVSLAGKRVLLLGAGGAARGVICPLLQAQVKELVISNRTCAKSIDLVQMVTSLFPAVTQLSAMDWAQLSHSEHAFDVIINATSASLHDEATPAISPMVFSENCLAYDMAYGDSPSTFLQFSQSHGANIRDGLGMLVEQAAEAFFVWHQVRPDTEPVLHYLKHGK
jgi:shikimate dehydrogenase